MNIKKAIKFWKGYEGTILDKSAKDNISKLEKKLNKKIQKDRMDKSNG